MKLVSRKVRSLRFEHLEVRSVLSASPLAAVAAPLGSAPALSSSTCCAVSSSITGNFNGTAIAGGNYVWFSSVFKVNGMNATSGLTIKVTGQMISFTANGVNRCLNVPDSLITFSCTAKTATTTFSNGQWVTILPTSNLSGNDFLSGFTFQAPPCGLPGGIKNVTWKANFSTNKPGVHVNWQWAAAVYKSFTCNYNNLCVKPVDDNHASSYQTSDHAGTPEMWTLPGILPGGATGGGGSNWTGSYSGTASVNPPVCFC